MYDIRDGIVVLHRNVCNRPAEHAVLAALHAAAPNVIDNTRSNRSLREPSRGSCYYIYAYFTPRGPRITHPKNGCDRFGRFCGTWEQTDGRTVNYSKIIVRRLNVCTIQDNNNPGRSTAIIMILRRKSTWDAIIKT